MHASHRVGVRQVALFLLILGTTLAMNPGGRASAQAPAMRWDGLVELISGRYPYTPPVIEPPTAADMASTMSRHALSADGRYILFNSDASNLGMGYVAPALYIRDRRTSETRVLMAGPALNGTLSADGNHIAFEVCDPYGRPEPRPDGALFCDVYALDLQTWAWTLVSGMPDGTFGDDDSRSPVLSSNGRFVVFRTKAGNLSGGTQGIAHLVLRDRDSDGNGILDEPGTVTLDTISAGGPGGDRPGNGDSDTAEVSDDGRFVAFRSRASDLVLGDHNMMWDVFLRDRQTRRTRRINLKGGVEESDWPVDSPQISMTPDGRYIAYASADPMLAPASYDDWNGVTDVFVYDRLTSTTARVDIGWGPPIASGLVPGNAPTQWPTLSADGRYVSLQSEATNVEVPPATPGMTHVYVFDRETQRVTRVSVRPDGTEPDRPAVSPAISADGSLVTFMSGALNLSPQVFSDVDRIYAAVHFELTPAEAQIPGSGGSTTFNITAQQHTQWWVDWSSQWPYWLQLDAAPSGVGDGSISFRIDNPNPDPIQRSYTVRIHSKTALLTQLEGMSVTGVSPVSGPDTGGTRVTVSGTGFEPGVTVLFDGYDAVTEFVNSTTLVATTPPHAPGTVWVATFSTDYRQTAWIDQAFHYSDTTPPDVWASAGGEEGGDGWFRSDVYVSFAWGDQQSEVTSSSGCDYRVVTTDTPGTTFTCTATSEGGTGSGSVTVKRDTAPPSIVFSTPGVRQLFEQGVPAYSSFTCSDALSGVAQCGVSAPSGAQIDTLTPGWHSLNAEATDVAGSLGWNSIEYAVSTDVCVPSLPDMVAWWRMEGHTKNTRSNITSPATRVGLSSDVFVDALVGQGFEFDGTGYLNTGFAFRVPGNLNYAIGAWVKPSANTFGTILRKKDQYSIARTTSGTLAWAFRKFNNPTLTYVDTGVSMPLNVWSHVVVVLQGSEVRTYLNGRIAHTATSIGDVYTWDNMFEPITIGGAQDRGEYFRGALDELQIFQQGLDADRIEQLFLSGPAGACPPKATEFSWTSPIQATFLSSTYSIVVRLIDENGEPVVGRSVHLESIVGAAPYSTSSADRVTDEAGSVHWDAPLKGAPPGLYSDYLSLTFAGDTEYVRAYAEPDVLVNKAVPTVTWAAPAPITYGTALDSAQLNATASVPGTFSYSPPAGTVLPVGTHDIAADFTPSDTTYYTSATAWTTVTVNKATPVVVVTDGTFTYDGQPHPATGTVSGVGGAVLGSPTFTYNGSPEPPVNAGTYDVVGTFAGNADYVAASGTATITIGKAAPPLTWSTPASIVYGSPLGPAQLQATSNVPGSFTYTPAAGAILGAGSGHALSATFTPADAANYTTGTIGSTITVTPAPLTVRANDASKHFGAPVPPFSAAFAGFVNGESPANLLGSLVLSTTATQQSAVGAYPIVPSGVTSPNYAISFANGSLSVVRGSVSVGVVTSPQPSGFNQPMTFSASVIAAAPAAGSPGGTVQFLDGSTVLGTVTLSGGVASLTTAGLPAGAHTIEARYSGDGSFETGTGASGHTINTSASTPALTLTSSRNPSSTGQSVTLTANVSMSAGPVSGSVQFWNGATLIGTSPISAGRATLAISSLTIGSHAITARYLGSASAPPAISGVFVQAVGGAGWKNRTTAASISSSENPSVPGAALTFTATISGNSGAPTGRVLFMINGTVVGDATGVGVTPVSGSTVRAVLAVPGLAHGIHNVSITYLGDSNYKGSTATVAQTVN